MKPLGITPPANYTGQPGRLLIAGIDSLQIGYFGEMNRDILNEIYSGERAVLLNGLAFDVRGEPRSRYDLALDNPRMRLSLGVSARSAESPPILVQLKSELLWSQGFAQAYQCGLDVVSFLCDGEITGEKVSRVDLCADFEWQSGFDVSHTNTIVTKARKITTENFGKQFCGFTIGKEDLRATIYDKSLQVRKYGKTWFYKLWGSESLLVWRVEFQFKRESLRRFGIETISDLINKSQVLWDYATNKWLIMRKGNDSNVSRRPLTEFWKLVQAVKLDLWADTTSFDFPQSRSAGQDKNHLVNTIAGHIHSYAVKSDYDDLLVLDDVLPALRTRLQQLKLSLR